MTRAITRHESVPEVREGRPLLEAEQGDAAPLETAAGTERQPPRDRREAVTELGGLPHDEFRGLRGRRGPDVRDEVCDRHVDLVPHG